MGTSIWLYAVCGGLVSGLVSYWRARRRAARVERIIREQRIAASTRITYRVPASHEVELVRLLDAAGEIERGLRDAGFVALGVLVGQPAGRDVFTVSRVLVDGAGTAVAYVVVLPSFSREPGLMLESYAPDCEVVTIRTKAQMHIARPPFTQCHIVSPDTSIHDLASRHCAVARGDDPGRPLIRVTSLEDLIEQLQRFHTMMVGWREAQPPQQLLEADLRGLLGANYERWGEAWARRLALKLPKATVRR